MTCGGAAVAGIIPRWEWRVFGTGFGAAEEAFSDLTPGPIAESDEVYLLSAAGSNVKVRGGLMDIKFLREAAGEAFASRAGCPDQTATCLRHLPVADIVENFTT